MIVAIFNPLPCQLWERNPLLVNCTICNLRCENNLRLWIAGWQRSQTFVQIFFVTFTSGLNLHIVYNYIDDHLSHVREYPVDKGIRFSSTFSLWLPSQDWTCISYTVYLNWWSPPICRCWWWRRGGRGCCRGASAAAPGRRCSTRSSRPSESWTIIII